MKATTFRIDVYRSLRKTIDEGAKLESDVANAVAVAMKDWAVEERRDALSHTGSSRSPASLRKSTTASLLLRPTDV